MRGMEGTCRTVLPSLHIGSTANEMTGPNVIRRPHSRKKNQRVMNRQPSTSISGKHHPENYGRGSRPRAQPSRDSIPLAALVGDERVAAREREHDLAADAGRGLAAAVGKNDDAEALLRDHADIG